jgi:MFS transporter, ACDE family, multidrug resistance protein
MPKHPLPLWLNPNLRIIFGITLMAIVGTFAVAPALPEIVRDLKVSPSRIGLVMMVFTVPGIFIMPVIGALADMYGRHRVVGICLLIFGVAGCGCFFVDDFSALLTLRFIAGLGAAPLSSLNIAFISDFFTGREHKTAIGYNQAVLSIGAAALTTLGGILAAFNWRYPLVLAVLSTPIGLKVLFGWKTRATDAPIDWRQYFRQARHTLSKRSLWWHYFLTILGLMLVWGSYFVYFPILMGFKMNQSPSVIGGLMTVMMLCSALSSTFMGRLASIFSGKQLYCLSFLLYGLSLSVIPFAGTPWMEILPVAGVGIAQGIFIPTIQNFLSGASDLNNRGIVMAFYGSAIRLGQTLGPLAAGIALKWIEIDDLFWVCGGAYLLSAVCVALIFNER